MKKAIVILCSIILAFSSNAQKLKETDVPTEVKTKFATIYPDVKSVKWEKEDGKFEAEFEQNKIEIAVLFEANGTYVQAEVRISISSLPKGVNEYVSKNHAGKKIEEASKITDAKGSVTYEAEVGNSDYLFDANGNFLRKDSEAKDREDDDKK
jgi:hypothetical protein